MNWRVILTEPFGFRSLPAFRRPDDRTDWLARGLLAVHQEGRWQVMAVDQKHPALPRAIANPLAITLVARQSSAEATEESTAGQESVQTENSVLDRESERLLGNMLGEFVTRHTEAVISGSAHEMLGSEPAEKLHWTDCTLVRLPGSKGELAGVLCLSGRAGAWSRKIASFLRRLRAMLPWRWRMRGYLPRLNRRTGTGWRFSMQFPTSSSCMIRTTEFCG